jgi:hypothetical protein
MNSIEPFSCLNNQWVRFKARDVYIPDPQQVLERLYGGDTLLGKVIDITLSSGEEKALATVEIESEKYLLIVPVDKIIAINNQHAPARANGRLPGD